MRGSGRALVVAGAMVAAVLGSVAAANAATSTPSIQTGNFICSGSVCAIGPGNVGMPYAAGLLGTGGPVYNGPECNPYVMTKVGGTLPPGLQLGEPVCEWAITGTPTTAGTYTFTVQIAPQPNFEGVPEPDGTQQLSITIGTGSSDRVVLTRAVWSPHSVQKSLQVAGFDPNNGATYTVSVTATGAEVGTITERTPVNGGDGSFVANFRETVNLNNVTVTSSLGGSASIPVTVNNKYT